MAAPTLPAAPEVDVDSLRWWRRPRRLRRQLALTLAGTALVSLLIVGVLNFFAANALLTNGSREQLVSVAESRVNSIESGVETVVGQTAATAANTAVVDALVEFDSSFAALNSRTLQPNQTAELERAYTERLLEPLAGVGFDELVVDDVIPQSNAGRYLQYHYTLPTADDFDRAEIVDAGDGSDYSAVHARFHPFLSSLAESDAVSDVLLINRSGEVVYTVEKRIDFGADLTDDLLDGTALTDTVLRRLPRVRTGDAVIADFEIYIPGGGRPSLFAVAAVKDDTEVVGALAIGISVDALTAITTANGDFEGVGLGKGESYVVGRDLLLRSESRRWLEDPEAYLGDIDDPELERLIRFFGSPIGIQPVDTDPVRVALDGGTFQGSSRNYLGDRTFAYARQISVGGVDWVVVAEQPLSELRAPLYGYAFRLGIVLALVLPAAALIGYFVADRLTRSIPPVVEMASEIAAGARDLDPPNLGSNEFGDLARRLVELAGQLGAQEDALSEEFERRRELLLSVLPPRLVMDEGEIGGTGESNDVGTVIAITIEVGGGQDDDDESAEFLRRFGRAVQSRAEQLDIERIRAAHDRFLFLAGVDRTDDGAHKAMDFALELLKVAASVSEADEVTPVVHIGMSTGPVATGVLESGSITFSAWGEPVRRALAIGALSTANEILVDESTAEALGDVGTLRPAADVIALDGEPMSLFTVAPR